MQHIDTNASADPSPVILEDLDSIEESIIAGSIGFPSAVTKLRKHYRDAPRHSIRTQCYIFLPKRNSSGTKYNIHLEHQLQDLLVDLASITRVWTTVQSAWPEWQRDHRDEARRADRFDDLLPDVIDEFERLLDTISDPQGFMNGDAKGSDARKTFNTKRNEFIGGRDRLFDWIAPSSVSTTTKTWTEEQKRDGHFRNREDIVAVGSQLKQSLKGFEEQQRLWEEFASLHPDWETRWPGVAKRSDRWDDALPAQIDEITLVWNGYEQARDAGLLSEPGVEVLDSDD